ncbi:hypothetical protein GE061_016295 [Apolygus lucorum]|uniref:BED-type domain-containing protein n=1 Tax=Apolygus lucorum TaxID=248454 RepID=A0A6A4K4E7_APOLU|nr:hypothetical protein GE061_016295 [Apolygus lucorum]
MSRLARDPTIDLMTDSGSDSSVDSEFEYHPMKKRKGATGKANKTVAATKVVGKQIRYKQRYRPAWEKDYPWVRPSEKDEFHFFCSLCDKSYQGGITEIVKHESSYKHSTAALNSQGEFTPQAFGKPSSRCRPKYPIYFGTVPEVSKDTPKTRSQAVTKAKLCFEPKLMKIEKEEESSTAVKNIPNKKGVIVHPHSVPSTPVSSHTPTGEVLNQITIHTATEESVITDDGEGEAQQSSPPSPPSAQVPSDDAVAQDPGTTSASTAQELFDSMVETQLEPSTNEVAEGDSVVKTDQTFFQNPHGLTPEDIANRIRASQSRTSKTYRQKYRKAWEAEFSWVEMSKVDEFHFHCKACVRDYYGGLSEIMNHGATAKHCVSEYKRLAALNDPSLKQTEVASQPVTRISVSEPDESFADDADTSTYERSFYKSTSPAKSEQLANHKSTLDKSRTTYSSLEHRSPESLRWSKELVESELKLVKRRAEIVEVEMRTALLNEHTAMLKKKVAAAELKLKEAELSKHGLIFKKKACKK